MTMPEAQVEGEQPQDAQNSSQMASETPEAVEPQNEAPDQEEGVKREDLEAMKNDISNQIKVSVKEEMDGFKKIIEDALR